MKYFKFLIIALFVFFYKDSIAQSSNYDNWQVKDGLPQNTINEIIQTRDGYIWLATEGGLARFDGVKFTVFNSTNVPQIKSNRIERVFETANGDLIIVANGSGLTVYRNNKFIDYSQGMELFHRYFKSELKLYKSGIKNWIGKTTFFQNKQNLIFMNTEGKGTVVLDPTTYKNMKGFESIENGTLILTPTELSTPIFKNEIRTYKFENELKEIGSLNNPYSVGKWKDEKRKCTWSFENQQLNQYRNGQIIKTYRLKEGIWKNQEKLRFAASEDNIIITDEGGSKVLRFDTKNNVFKITNLEFKFEIGSINQIYVDKENNVWFATSTAGLVKEKPLRFSYFDTDAKLISRNFYPIIKTDSNTILIGTQKKGIYKFDINGKFQPFKENLKNKTSDFYCMNLEYFKGNIYYTRVPSKVLYKINGDEIKEINLPIVSSSDNHPLYKTKNNNLIIGAFNKIFYLDNDSIIDHPANGKFNYGNISSFFEDHLNRLLIISDKDVYRYDSKSNSTIRLNIPVKNYHYFRGVHEDSEGRVYVGSYGNGLTIIIGESTFQLTLKNGLVEDVVSTITSDKRGHLWLTGNKGLTRIKKQDIIDFIDNKTDKINTVLYNEQTDNLRTGEFNGGVQHSKCWLGDEVYLFPTLNGCVKVDFAKMKYNNLPPPVKIESIIWGDSVQQFTNKIDLNYAEKRLEIDFTALSFVSPQNVRFKYKLEGYEEEWIDGGAERKTFYNKIPPGKYKFKVIACNNEGVWNNVGASIELRIIPPIFMTVWFKILTVIFTILLLGFIIYKVIESRQKRQRNKSALMDILPDLVIKMDAYGNYLDIYGNPESLIEPAKNLIGKSINQFFSKELISIIENSIDTAIQQNELQQFEYELTLQKNENKYFECRIIAIDKSEVLFVIRDITAAKKANIEINEKELQILKALEIEKKLLQQITEQQKKQLEAIMETEENERRRIATDLHDGIGQLLSGIKINLAVAQEKIHQTDLNNSIELLEKSQQDIIQITNELRNISYNLLPPSLEHFGLSAAINEEVKKLKLNPALTVEFSQFIEQTRFNHKIEITLFRIFQELLNNILKHANASEITIQLIQHEMELIFMMEDNGKGFDLQKGLEKIDSRGLKNLYSRLALIDGKIKIDSSKNAGTSITIEVSNINGEQKN